MIIIKSDLEGTYMANNKIKDSYTADDIQILRGLDAVRKRPAMYIGSTNATGLHHLVWEIVDNAVDEALSGFGSKIVVTIHKDGSCSVLDEGRGIPCGINKETGRPAIELVFTELHAGGKFNNAIYKSAGGMHGVGASVTNALSEYLDATVYRDGTIYHIKYDKTCKSPEKTSSLDRSPRRRRWARRRLPRRRLSARSRDSTSP